VTAHFRNVYLSVDLDYWTACPEEHIGEQARTLRGRDPLDVMMSEFLAAVLEHAPQVILATVSLFAVNKQTPPTQFTLAN
jgi:hypothetical protein